MSRHAETLLLLLVIVAMWIGACAHAAPVPVASSTSNTLVLAWDNTATNTDGLPCTNLQYTQMWRCDPADTNNGWVLVWTIPAATRTNSVLAPAGVSYWATRHVNNQGLSGALSDWHEHTNTTTIPGKPGRPRP